MEKLKIGKKVVDIQCKSDKNASTSENSSGQNNSQENYTSVVTRSALAKRARVSLNNSKSDKFTDSKPKGSKTTTWTVPTTTSDEPQESNDSETIVKQETRDNHVTETEQPSKEQVPATKDSPDRENVAQENLANNNLVDNGKEGVGRNNWNLINQDPSEQQDGSTIMARELKSSSLSPQQAQQQITTTMTIKSEKKKSPSSIRSSPVVVESSPNSTNNSHGGRQNKNKGSSTTNKNHGGEKPKLAPMLLMNNLPYMGELTFDTRPRRGRKPKKADICHLISKNYGIQFPHSYVNIPVSSPTPRISTLTTTTTTTSGGGSKSTKNKSTRTPRSSQNNNNGSPKSSSSHVNVNNNHISGSSIGSNFIPGINWSHQLPPDLLPLASLNPSVFLYPKNAVNKQQQKISSMLQPLQHYHQHLQQQQQVHEQLQQFSKHFVHCDDLVQSSDEPLNLCVRDEDSSLSHHPSTPPTPSTTPLNLNFNQNCTPSTTKPSATNLFNNFNLKRSSSANKNSTSSSSVYHGRGSSGSGGSKDRSKNTTNNNNLVVSDDSNLVNLQQLNLSASKLANYVNSANNNRPMTLGGGTPTNSDRSGSPANKLNVPSLPPNVLGVKDGGISGGKSPKGRRKRSSTAYRPLNASGSVTGSHPQFNNNHHPNMTNHHGHPTNSIDLSSSPFASSSNNPAEVSICKFKFTGGAKPSLQEKKMLSVDAGGNFRFYSDKASTSSSSKNNVHHGGGGGGSIKDEFSHCGEIVSAHGLPKSAKSMSMCMPLPIPTVSTCSMLSEMPGIMSPSYLKSHMSPSEDCSSSSDGTTSSTMTSPTGSGSGLCLDMGSSTAAAVAAANKMKRKRRTRKSLMREKLEKTFKEKGFLIQTQQLESAEGATYCKFRQLRKFTRYLFRSWKDYLPDNLKAINPAAGPSPLQDLQPPSSELSESMEMETDHDKGQDDTEGGSETPDMSLSPSHDDLDDPQEEEDGDVEDLDDP